MFYGTCPWVYYIKAGSRQWKKHLMRMMNTMDGLDCPAVSIIIGIPYKPRKSHSFHRSSPCHPLYLMEFHPRHSSVLIRIRRIIFLVLPPPNSIKIKQWKDIAANWAWNGQDNEVRWWFFYIIIIICLTVVSLSKELIWSERRILLALGNGFQMINELMFLLYLLIVTGKPEINWKSDCGLFEILVQVIVST